LLSGEEEDGFDLRLQAAVHQGHLEFVFVVGDGADAAHDYAGAFANGVVREKAVEEVDFDVRVWGRDGDEHFHPLGYGEERGFALVAEDGYDELVAEARAAGDDVEMAAGYGIEGSGIDGDQLLIHMRVGLLHLNSDSFPGDL
jgi:hypothetical protein